MHVGGWTGVVTDAASVDVVMEVARQVRAMSAAAVGAEARLAYFVVATAVMTAATGVGAAVAPKVMVVVVMVEAAMVAEAADKAARVAVAMVAVAQEAAWTVAAVAAVLAEPTAQAMAEVKVAVARAAVRAVARVERDGAADTMVARVVRAEQEVATAAAAEVAMWVVGRVHSEMRHSRHSRTPHRTTHLPDGPAANMRANTDTANICT